MDRQKMYECLIETVNMRIAELNEHIEDKRKSLLLIEQHMAALIEDRELLHEACKNIRVQLDFSRPLYF